MKKQLLVIVLVLAMTASMIPAITITSFAATWTGTSGSGTSADPWLISTPVDLVALQTFTNTSNTKGSMYFKLANDIDLTGISWIPMGLNSGDPGFNAHLDGNNKKISNVSIGTSAAYYKGRYGGFFGVISSGSVSNLGIENITIFGDDTGQPDGRYGGMVGWHLGSQASNCYVKNVSLTMSSNSRTYGGGFAGWMALDWTGASISNCCVIGTNFISSAVAAGFCAIAIQNGGGAQYATISNCFAVGFTDIKNVSSFSWGKAGFIKRWDNPAHTSLCYYNYSGTSKLDTDGSTDVNCVSKTLTEFADGTVLALLNGSNGTAWQQGPEDAYPRLTFQTGEPTPSSTPTPSSSPSPSPSATVTPDEGNLLIGTPFKSGPKRDGSTYGNQPDVYECFDNDPNTKFMLNNYFINSPTCGGYVGLDFGENNGSSVKTVKMLIGDDNERWHMMNDGAEIQGSFDGVNYETIHKFSFDDNLNKIYPNWQTLTLSQPSKFYRYLRLYSVGCYLGCYMYELQFYGDASFANPELKVTPEQSDVHKLVGTYTDDVHNYNMNYLYDEDPTTYVGNLYAHNILLDLGEGKAASVYKVRYHPQVSNVGAVNGAKFEGSNDGAVFEPLAVAQNTVNGWNEITFNPPTLGYRYLRYETAQGNALWLADLDWYGKTDYTISYLYKYLGLNAIYSVKNTLSQDKTLEAFAATYDENTQKLLDVAAKLTAYSKLDPGETTAGRFIIANHDIPFNSKLMVMNPDTLEPMLQEPYTFSYSPATVQTEFQLPNYYLENMVLQRDKDLKIAGAALPGVPITVTLDGNTRSTVAGDDGKWQVIFDPHAKGGPYSLTVQSPHQTKTINEVYIGEVLLCTGQSNMNIPYNGLLQEFDFDFQDNAHIKYLSTSNPICSSGARNKTPQFDISPGTDIYGYKFTAWKNSTSGSARNFTAVGYATAYALSQAEPDLYIGVIMAAEGGAPIGTYLPGGNNYNSRVAPFFNYTVGAILWDQGESDEGAYQTYYTTVANMVNDWREKLGDEDLPFFYSQLTRNYNGGWTKPLIQDSQRRILTATAFKNPNNIDMVVAIDTDRGTGANPDGNYSTHCNGKWLVGARFAGLYKKYVWDQNNLQVSSPVYKSSVVSGNKIIVTFDNVYDGLKIKDVDNSWAVANRTDGALFDTTANNNQKLCEFQIAGADKVYHDATATILPDSTVEVSSPDVPNPLYVRYAFKSFPINPNLVNSAGLPASPFTTEF